MANDVDGLEHREWLITGRTGDWGCEVKWGRLVFGVWSFLGAWSCGA